MSDTEAAERLASIEERLIRIESTLSRAEQTFAMFLAGPGRKLMRLLGCGKADS